MQIWDTPKFSYILEDICRDTPDLRGKISPDTPKIGTHLTDTPGHTPQTLVKLVKNDIPLVWTIFIFLRDLKKCQLYSPPPDCSACRNSRHLPSAARAQAAVPVTFQTTYMFADSTKYRSPCRRSAQILQYTIHTKTSKTDEGWD